MKKTFFTKTKVLILTFSIIIFAVVVFLIFSFNKFANEYQRDLSYHYSRSMGELTENLNNIKTTLNKSNFVSTSSGFFYITGSLREFSGSAKSAISQLPFSDNNSKEIEKTLSVISDFSLYVGRKVASGEKLDPNDYLGFDYLSKHCDEIIKIFSDIEKNIIDNKASIGETRNTLERTLMLPSIDEFDSNLGEMEQALSTLPSQDYDGIHSAHIKNKEAEFLANKEEISSEQALTKASEYLKISKENLELINESEGNLASYQFSGDNKSIKITKKGGEVLYYKNSNDFSVSSLQYEQALETATKILNNNGYSNMKADFYTVNDNICNINFYATKDNVMLYTDEIKMSIELEKGETVEFTSDGYLLYHKERENLTPEIDLETAQNSISKNLQINSNNLAIIASPGGNEILCYEFSCNSKDGQDVSIFINTTTGQEEKIVFN